VSEYQYYEFQAFDRPLTNENYEALPRKQRDDNQQEQAGYID
jgi:hypothetical protein